MVGRSVSVVLRQRLGESVDVSPRRAQVVGDRIAECFERVVHRFKFGGAVGDALLEFGIEQADFLLGSFALGDVSGNADEPDDFSGAVAMGRFYGQESPCCTGGDDFFFLGMRRAFGGHPEVVRANAHRAIRVQELPLVAADDGFDRSIHQACPAGIDGQVAAFQVLDQDHVVVAVGHRAAPR